MNFNLGDICEYAKGKVAVSELNTDTYISTENMLPNKGGITRASSLPSVDTTPAYMQDDVLVSNIRPYFKKIWHATEQGGCSNDVLVFRAKANCDPVFLYYVLANDEFFDYATATAKGTKMPRGDKTAIMQYAVPDFDKDAQRRIGKLLRCIDQKIVINSQINDNLQQQARTIFQEWIVSAAMTESPHGTETKLGNLADGFSVCKTGDLPIFVTDYVANGSFASLKENVRLYQEPNYAYFIRNTDLKAGTFEVFVDEHSYKFLSKSRLFGGEIIISNVGDVGSVFLCPVLDRPMTLGNNIIMLKPEQETLRYYLYLWFKWSMGQELIQGIKGGSAQPKFNKTDFKSLPIIMPPQEALQKFHNIVQPMFAAIEINTNENRRLALLRDAILPKLMSGEIDVSDIQI